MHKRLLRTCMSDGNVQFPWVTTPEDSPCTMSDWEGHDFKCPPGSMLIKFKDLSPDKRNQLR